MTEHVVVVDDDDRIQRLLARYLERNGYRVTAFGRVQEARARWQAAGADAVILDLVLPDGSGLDLARDIRSQSDLPIIMLTGKDDVVDRVVGLELGADDYITKPFDERELLARLHSVLRRSATAKSAGPAAGDGPSAEGIRLFFNGWVLDRAALELRDTAGVAVELTGYEFRLLELLVTRAQRILTRDQILEALADRSWSPYDRSIDVMIGKLRRKLGDDPQHPNLIKTIRGMGYKFTATVTRA